MPYCPKCHTEYLPGNTRCSDCDIELVDSLPPEEDFDVDTKTVLLCQVNDLSIAGIIEETLKEKGIPCLVKSSMGSYSSVMPMDSVMRGVKIYVPESAFNEALEIAETIIPDFERPDENN